MTGKRPIDIKRDAAITLYIGGDDKSAVEEVLSTGDDLYVIKESGVFKIQLADNIDPGRTNPNIPNLTQQVLTEGCNSEVVARILLTAKTLFDEHNATVKPFVATLFEKCLALTRQLLELNTMTRELADEIGQKEAAFNAKPAAPNAFNLPSVPGIDTKLHSILFKADKAKDTMLEILRLQVLPDAVGKVKLKALDDAVEASLQSEPQLIDTWKGLSKYFGLIRNMRNACEHPDDTKSASLTDFSMQPSAEVYPPLVEIRHPDTPIRTLPLVEFLDFIRNGMIERAETALVFIKVLGLLKHNPFGEVVAEFPEKERRHKFVRYYRAVDMSGTLRILG